MTTSAHGTHAQRGNSSFRAQSGKQTTLPLDYISEDILSKGDSGRTEKGKGKQNQGSGPLTEL